jgi:hypothetical protein
MYVNVYIIPNWNQYENNNSYEDRGFVGVISTYGGGGSGYSKGETQ